MGCCCFDLATVWDDNIVSNGMGKDWAKRMKFKITWFIAFGLFLAGLILIGGTVKEACEVLLSYYLGGLACVMVNTEGKAIPTLKDKV